MRVRHITQFFRSGPSARRPAVFILLPFLISIMAVDAGAQGAQTVARQWDEEIMGAIRLDLARPSVHGRNLFHMSIAMWDGWAVYDTVVSTYLTDERHTPADIPAARDETISYACYRVLTARFKGSPGEVTSLPSFYARMLTLGYDIEVTTTVGNTPAAIGNRIAANVLAFGAADGANEQNSYDQNIGYAPVNEPMIVKLPGTTMVDPNRWQPLAIDFFIDQSGNPIPEGNLDFLTPHWGQVTPFALTPFDLGPAPAPFFTYFDPGAPPKLGGVGDSDYRLNANEVVFFSSVLSPDVGGMINISPSVQGNRPVGSYNGTGHSVNPFTGMPYEDNFVKLGDWGRVIAEFWADGPSSETPPGHWNVLANEVMDHPLFERRFGGEGPIMDALEYDVKLYLVLNGAVHDAAVAAWGLKGYYDYVRPISAIRYMSGLGQSTSSALPSYHPQGILLADGIIELITAESTAPGERHEQLAGMAGENIGKIAVFAWIGAPADPDTQYSGVGWILAENWVPYQRPTFVTPPFSGYISGHSTFSRAAAEVMTLFTGTPYFPGGLGEFTAPTDDFLVFEIGPSETVVLQWATYYDAADEAGVSRLYGGIHPRADDLPGRIVGSNIGRAAFGRGLRYFNGTANQDFNAVTTGHWGLYE